MPETPRNAIAVVGVDIGKNSFHVIGLDRRGAIVLRQKWSRRQVESKRCFSPYFAALTLREDFRRRETILLCAKRPRPRGEAR